LFYPFIDTGHSVLPPISALPGSLGPFFLYFGC
jgi:hypothetical protein